MEGMTLKEVKYFKLQKKIVYKYISFIQNASFAWKNKVVFSVTIKHVFEDGSSVPIIKVIICKAFMIYKCHSFEICGTRYFTEVV